MEHFAAIHYRDMPAFMTDLRQYDSVAALALQFLILTASRSDEIFQAQWDEIHPDNVWIKPKERNKNRSRSSGTELRKPLSAAALAILEQVKGLDDKYVFPGRSGRRGLSDGAFRATLRLMKRTGFTPHGMRSTFKDWCNEKTNFPDNASELALGHIVGTEVERAYRRGDMLEKRFELAEAWARSCLTPPAENVVPFGKREQQAGKRISHHAGMMQRAPETIGGISLFPAPAQILADSLIGQRVYFRERTCNPYAGGVCYGHWLFEERGAG